MNIINRTLTLCAATMMCVAAHSASLRIGYCEGEVTDDGVSKVGKTTISAAIILHEKELAKYTGAEVTGIRVGLATAEGIDNLTGWIRPSLESDNLDEVKIQSPQAGWNEASLDGGVKIDGKPLAVGFSYSQGKSVQAISLVGTPVVDGFWLGKYDTKTGVDKWEAPSSAFGVLSVELIISDPSFPEKDIEITDVAFDEMPVKHGSDIAMTVTVHNAALKTIDNFTWGYETGDEKKSFSVNSTLNPQEYAVFTCEIPTSSFTDDETRLLKVTVDTEADGKTDNNYRDVMVGTYTNSIPRMTLIEEFTSEECGNCPRGIGALQECMDNGYANHIAIVAHHVGYKYDWLTVEEDKVYEWFYDPQGLDGTFAPAVMLDRTMLPRKKSPVRSLGYYSEFAPQLDDALGIPAFVSVDVAMDYDADTHNLDVIVNAEKLPVFDTQCMSPRINVYLVEDKILHHNQAGISSDTFTHSHVYRKRLTDTWGDSFSWDGGKMTRTFSCTVPDSWKVENLEAVAFIASHDADDIDNCRVFNAAKWKTGTTAIGLPTFDNEAVSVEYYDISGRKVAEPTNGLYIRRAIHPDGKVTADKIMIQQ